MPINRSHGRRETVNVRLDGLVDNIYDLKLNLLVGLMIEDPLQVTEDI